MVFALESNCYENSETQRPHNAQEGNNQRVIILDTDGFDYTVFFTAYNRIHTTRPEGPVRRGNNGAVRRG